jgi:hypothetical protein
VLPSFAHQVLVGRRPIIPDSVPRDVRDVICSCWAQHPRARPSITAVYTRLEVLVVQMAAQQKQSDIISDDDD